MPNDNPISPQEAEAILKRLFAVAELLAKSAPTKHSVPEILQNQYENHKDSNVLYRKDEEKVDRQ